MHRTNEKWGRIAKITQKPLPRDFILLLANVTVVKITGAVLQALSFKVGFVKNPNLP